MSSLPCGPGRRTSDDFKEYMHTDIPELYEAIETSILISRKLKYDIIGNYEVLYRFQAYFFIVEENYIK